MFEKKNDESQFYMRNHGILHRLLPKKKRSKFPFPKAFGNKIQEKKINERQNVFFLRLVTNRLVGS